MALRQLSVQERAEARRKALQARQARAELKAAFAAGAVGLADVFARADTEDAVARQSVSAFLNFTHRASVADNFSFSARV